MPRIVLAVVSVVAGAFACSSSSSGGFKMNPPPVDGGPVSTEMGTVNGKMFTAAYAVAATGTDPMNPDAITILIGNEPDLCPLATPAVENKTIMLADLQLIVMQVGIPGSPIAKGMYSSGVGMGLTPSLATYNSKCEVEACGTTADTTGTITFTKVPAAGSDTGWYEGSYALTYSAQNVSGDFQAPICPPPKDAGVDSGFGCQKSP